MKAIIDDKIPYIRSEAERLFDSVVYLPGHMISPADVADADVLIVRTRTHCNSTLLEGSKVQFIATATIGYDHLDTQWLDCHHIGWSNCPGCNASSVGQYIESCLLLLMNDHIIPAHPTVGIVGVGHVGSQVALKLELLGCKVLPCDPPRAEWEDKENFYSLEELVSSCHVITFHTPLSKECRHATFHLADKKFFDHLSLQPVIINAARGGVVDEHALMEAMDNRLVRKCIIDTWENEPNISPSLLQRAYIATPHIAGYSADGKCNASRMALEAVCRHFGWKEDIHICPPELSSPIIPASDSRVRALQLYNPLHDSVLLKEHPERFESLRNNYPVRREMFPDTCHLHIEK